MSQFYLQDIHGKDHLLSIDDFIDVVNPKDEKIVKETLQEFYEEIIINTKKDNEIHTVMIYEEDKNNAFFHIFMDFLTVHADKLSDLLCQKKLNVKYVRGFSHYEVNDMLFLNVLHDGKKAIIKGFAFCSNPEKEEIYVSTVCGTGGTAKIFKHMVDVMMYNDYKKPLSFIHLESIENTNTINFYSKLGFRKTDEDTKAIIKDMFKSKAKTFSEYVTKSKNIVGGSMYLFAPDTRGERQLKKHKCHYIYTPAEWFDEINKLKKEGKDINYFLKHNKKEKLEGGGLGSFFRGVFNYVVDPVLSTINPAYYITKKVVQNIDTIKNYLAPYLNSFTNATQQVINQYGNNKVIGFYIRRTPVKDVVMGLVNLVTMGEFDELKKEAKFDKMFHLGLEVEINDNGAMKHILMEKNERIDLVVNKPVEPLTEYFKVYFDSTQSDLTINDLLSNALKCMGERNFFDYDAFTNNCQVFVMKLLQCSNIEDNGYTNFVLQNVEEIAQKLPKGEQNLMRAFTTLGAVFSKITGAGKYKGGGPIPEKNILHQIVSQSYKEKPLQTIGDLTLISYTPTLKFYKDNNDTIVVGIRGTEPTDADDVKADTAITINNLENTNRYEKDLKTIKEFQNEYPNTDYDYYGVGHSLGGAILDLFLKGGYIKKGISYNPAVQPQDFKNTTLENHRIYNESDPLYQIMGLNLSKKPETRQARQKSWWEIAGSFIPYLGVQPALHSYHLLQSHKLDQFKGGKKKRKTKQNKK